MLISVICNAMERGMISITNGRVTITPADGTVWMTQHEIADLFGCFVSKVGSNIRTILKAGILDESRVCYRHWQADGNLSEHYNLEIITALAFRIRSQNADLFRRWLMERATLRPTKQAQVFVTWSEKMLLN